MFRTSRLYLAMALTLTGLGHSALAQPDNDSLAHAIELTGEHIQTDVFFLGATRAADDPAVVEGPSVWYTWRAPRNGWLRLYPNPLAYLFQGSEPALLTNQEPVTSGLAKFYQVTTNQSYAIAVVSPGANADGTFTPVTFQLDFATAPTNDLFSERVALAGDTVEARGATVGAEQQPGEPFAAVWWTWNAPANGRVSLELIEPAGGAVAAYSGNSPQSLTFQGQVSDPQYPSTFPAQAGQPYQLAVGCVQSEPVAFRLTLERILSTDGLTDNQVFHQGQTLDIHFGGIVAGDQITNLNVDIDTLGMVLETNTLALLHMPFLPPGNHTLTARAKAVEGRRYASAPVHFSVQSPNDYFDARSVLTGDDVTVEANLRGAPPYPQINLLWWKWTAPHAGVIHVEQVAGEALSWALFKGPTLETLQPVNDWSVQAGETYSLQASALHSVGTYRFRILNTPPANDDFANARPLDGKELWEPIRIDTATPDPGEPGVEQAPGLPSIWFSFTPTVTGVARFGAGISPDTLTPYLWPCSVFSGDSLDALTAIAPLDGECQFALNGGQPYTLRLQKAFPSEAGYTYVYFLFTPTPTNDAVSQATLLTGERAQFTLCLEGATAVLDEPTSYVGYVPQRSVWYQWRPPYDGFAAVRFPGSTGSIAVGIEVYTNGANLAEAPVSLLENEGIFFDAHADTTYYLRFSDFSGLGTNQYPIELSLTRLSLASPQPDAAFMAPGGPEFAIPPQDAIASVSYREKTGFGSGGLLRFATWSEVTNSTTAPYSCTVTNLPVGWHTLYALITDTNGETTYLPPVEIEIRPANDSFATRQVLTGRKVSVEGSTVSATTESGEPSIGNPVADRSVWYSWTAPSSAPTVVRVYGENYVRVFEGTSLADLVQVNPTAPTNTVLSFSSAAGRTYEIEVASVTTGPPDVYASTFSLSIDMDLLQILSPLGGRVYETEATVPIMIWTPELADQVVSTAFTATPEAPNRPIELLSTPGLATTYSWVKPQPGNYSILATLVFTSGEKVSRSTYIRVPPRNANFTNAIVLADGTGEFQPTFRGCTNAGIFPHAAVWYRFTAETNGYWVISTTNTTSVDLQVSTGLSTDSLLVVPQMGNLSQRGWAAIVITNGTTYNLRFMGDVGFTLPPLQYEVAQVPANDLFENAQILDGEHLSMHSMSAFATNQPGEPAHFGAPAQRTLWWKWVCPVKGYIATTGRVKIYTGDALTALSVLATGALVAPNTACFIVCDAGSSPTLYSDWKLDFYPTPPNDDFANRTQLTGRRVTFQADLWHATGETGEQALLPGWWNYGHTVWFTWSSPDSGQALVRRKPGGGWPRINLFRGDDMASLIHLDQDGYQPFDVQAGEKISICVDYNGGGPMSAVLEVLLNRPPVNDNFDQALPLSESASVASWNFGASREYGEPKHNQEFGSRSVWFNWTAKAAGQAELLLTGDIATNILAVYEGSTLDSLRPLAAATAPLTNYLTFAIQPDRTYHIVVDGVYGQVGDFTIQLNTVSIGNTAATINAVTRGDGRLAIWLQPGSLACLLERSEDLTNWVTCANIAAGQDEVDLPVDAIQAFFRIKQP